MLLMIDNYDSFTYNLVQYFGELGADVKVYRNDEITVEQIALIKPDQIVVSPGPCSPTEAGISVAAIKEFAGKIPMLGVCLGHQSIGAAFGGKIIHDITPEFDMNYGFRDIVADRFDAGVRLGNTMEKDMIAMPIGPPLRMAVIASPSYFAAHPIPKTPHDLTAHRASTRCACLPRAACRCGTLRARANRSTCGWMAR